MVAGRVISLLERGFNKRDFLFLAPNSKQSGLSPIIWSRTDCFELQNQRFSSSCAKEEVAPDASAEVVAAKKKGEEGLEKDVPSDCNCKMQVLSMSSNYTSPWRFADLTSLVGTYPYQTGSNFLIQGVGNAYQMPGVGLVDLPTPYMPLDPPDAGCHKFDLWLFNTSNDGEPVTLFTKVICCEGGINCTEANASTETYHQFTINTAPSQVQFWKYFSCSFIPAGDEPDCAGIHGEGDL